MKLTTPILLVFLASHAAHGRPTFTPLGIFVANGQEFTLEQPAGVTNTGVVAGFARSDPDSFVVRWSPALGYEKLTPSPDMPNGWAQAMSADASRIAVLTDMTTINRHLAIWSVLGVEHTTFDSQPRDMSADGSAVLLDTAMGIVRNGVSTPLFVPGTAMAAAPSAMSDDANTVAGVMYFTANYTPHAVFWSVQSGSFFDIQPFLGAPRGYLNAVSGNGNVFIGQIEDADFVNIRSFRWSFANGIQLIPAPADAPAHDFIYAADCSADGNVVIGMSIDILDTPAARGIEQHIIPADSPVMAHDSPLSFDPFVWTPQTGSRRLVTLLAASGVDLTAWIITGISRVSPDGRFLTGVGSHEIAPGVVRQEAWVVDLQSTPPLQPCFGDADHSRSVNFADITTVLGNWNAACP